MKLKSATIFTGICLIQTTLFIRQVRDTQANQWSRVKVASQNSANRLPINIQRTESTSAVFVIVMLSLLLVYVDFSVIIYRFETQPYPASLILPCDDQASYLDFLLARLANNSTRATG